MKWGVQVTSLQILLLKVSSFKMSCPYYTGFDPPPPQFEDNNRINIIKTLHFVLDGGGRELHIKNNIIKLRRRGERRGREGRNELSA